MMTNIQFTWKSWLLSLGATTALIMCVSFFVSRSYIAHNSLDLDESKRISACGTEVLKSLKPPLLLVDLSLLDHINYMCYQQAFEEDSLTDFGIRKSAYLNQQVQTPVMLWMVVAITLSGVVLAGIQILAAYRLASAGKAAFEQGGQLSIESNKISLSSSVTGVLILVVSLAFFFIFVKYVYLIQEVHLGTGVPPSATISTGAAPKPLDPPMSMTPPQLPQATGQTSQAPPDSGAQSLGNRATLQDKAGQPKKGTGIQPVAPGK
jgi:hypothetical protein